MNKLGKLYFLWYTLFLTLSITSTTTQAQELNSDSDTPLGSASDLRITPRLGVGYNTSGAGYDGFTRFEGFVPLLQTPGRTLTFIQGQLLLDNTANWGGNILLGHRFYTPEANRIFGGYLAYDNRHTGNTTFHQLGIGLETLGSIWDVRVNGYLPIGDTRQVVEERIVDTGLQLTDIFFQDHFLVQQARRERQEVRHLEAAMTGVDLEAGARLAQWGTTGELRGYAGLYYYDAAGTEGSLGWRLRLDIRPTNYLNLGVAFQEDELFGTNVLFNLGASWGGTPAAGKLEGNAVWARMGESVMRTASITVDGQTEIGEPFEDSTTIQATNPLTGEPYFFQQVNLQATGGNGTAENPFGTLAEALNAAQANQIVYVQGTTPPEIPGFTIPDGVSVLSTAPVQEIETVTFGRIPLPQSGSGTVPQIGGTVTMGNDTVLSGFAITNAQGSGIEATNISNAEIRDTQITSSTQAGVWLENITGTITLTNSVITGDRVASIIGTNVNNITVTDGSLISRESDTDGIKFDGVNGVVNISDSTITVTNPSQHGIAATNVNGSLTIMANEGSEITTASTRNAGVFLEDIPGSVTLARLDMSSTGSAAIQGTTVNRIEVMDSSITSRNSDTSGITFDGVSGVVNISDSPITVVNPIEQGIALRNVTGELTIAANQGSEITTISAGTSGVLVEDTMGSVRLSGFTISSTVGAVIQGNRINNLEIVDSTLTSIDSNQHGLSFNEVSGLVNISDSTITVTNPTQNGISATDISGKLNINANEGSLITTATNGVAGILLENATDTVMLSGLEVSSAGGSAFQGNQVNNVAIANSTLISSNSTTGGISLDTVTGTVEITDSTITILDPVNDTHGISINDVTGTVTIAANQGSEITTPNFGIELTDSPSGQFTISGFTIIDAQDSGIFGQNLGGLTFQGNTIRQATNQGIALNNVTGTVAIANNTITNTGSDRDIELPNGDLVPTGQGIAVVNTTGQVDLSISNNNQISDNFNDAILLSFSGDAVANTVTITGNTLENNGGVSPVRGDGIAMALDNTAIVDTLLISENTIRGNGDEGIDLRIGFFGENNARLENGTISNNLIDDNNQMGINLATANGGTQQLTVTQNRITNSGQQGINILAAVGSTQQITLSQNIIKDSGLEGVLFLTADDNNNSELTVIENTIENSGDRGIYILAVDDSRTIADIQRNTLANSNPIDLEVTVTPPSTFCLNLQDNTSLEDLSSTKYQLNNSGGTFLVVDLANLNINNTPNNSVMLSSSSFSLDNLTTLTACP
ncbi:right-handed parallel beta-helix repeat-containing protein [Coleofasciculus chthonoplastes]|uniref:right-handed parallel beta-helix repeat-containing protein n=1 Tax=Coleofasciculus chthonoplastes TaxID=64178 RepID=UPI0032FD5E70